ncbi:MAG: DUF5317 family protein [Acidimicrobiaceae bacterium]|nr:DUF5317 family protein [Acidimicrobiaceae bacterium]
MLLTIVALVVGGVIGLATGGKLRHAASRRIAWWGLLVIGFGLELAADRVLTGSASYAAMIAGPVCLLLWAAGNARLTGVGLVALGVLLNGLVLTLDRGMPVERAALARAGVIATRAAPVSVGGHRHHVATAADRFRVLDDRIALGPSHQVVSAGDIVLAVGTANLVVHLLWYQPVYQRSRRPRWANEGLGSRLARAFGRRGPSVT